VRLRPREFCTSAERLAWAKANGCPWGLWDNWFRTTNPCALAAGGGHLEALQWARQQGCPWRASTCEAAADGGHLELLKWARKHDCPWWGELVCAGAARGGHLQMLQWAREHDCPWDDQTCTCAAGGGQLELLQWARAHGCPWNKDQCDRASRNHPLIRAWMGVGAARRVSRTNAAHHERTSSDATPCQYTHIYS